MQVVICDRCGRALGTTAAQVNIYKAFRGETKMHVCKKCEIKLREWFNERNKKYHMAALDDVIQEERVRPLCDESHFEGYRDDLIIRDEWNEYKNGVEKEGGV